MNIEQIKGAPGWTTLASFFPKNTVEAVQALRDSFVKTRGTRVDGTYWRHSSGEPEPELAIWWTQQLVSEPAVLAISQAFIETYGLEFNDPVIYSADCIVNTELNQRCYPHVDSPYRFTEWQRDRSLLAIQCLVPLGDFSAANGATAVVNDSHHYHWSMEDAYQGHYDRFFFANSHQPRMGVGDVLVYHPRIMHSAMPNYTSSERLALLISICDRGLATRLKEIDNIWRD